MFGIGQDAQLAIKLSDLERRKKVDVKNEEGKEEKLPLFLDGENVSRKVHINLKGKKLEHQGIRVEFAGQVGSLNSTHHAHPFLAHASVSLQKCFKTVAVAVTGSTRRTHKVNHVPLCVLASGQAI